MPNGAYLHVLINHIPVILAPLGALALVLALMTRRRAIWIYGLVTVVLAGLSAYPVMLTGHMAEHVVRDAVPDVSKTAIHDHEEAGETAMWVLLLAGALAAYTWWKLGRATDTTETTNETTVPGLALWGQIIVVLFALAGAAAVAYASLEGGYIIHHEIHTP